MRIRILLAVVATFAAACGSTRTDVYPSMPGTSPGPVATDGGVPPTNDGGTGPSSPDAGPAPADCNSCIAASQQPGGACVGAITACEATAGCMQLVGCLNACADNTCVSACFNATSASDLALYSTLQSCFCNQACTSQCAANCSGSTSPDMGPPSSCTPKTCTANLSCGSMSDGCGGTLACGSCPGGQACSAENVCFPSVSGSVDTATCHGPAATNGSLSGAVPATTIGTTSLSDDPMTGQNYLVLLLQDHAAAQAQPNDIWLSVYFQPVAGTLLYTAKKCDLLRFPTTSTYQLLGETTDCHLVLSTLTLASAASTCDGIVVGTVEANFSGQVIVGSYDVPVDVSAAQLAPSCVGSGEPCSKNTDCCDQSCSMYLGVCN